MPHHRDNDDFARARSAAARAQVAALEKQRNRVTLASAGAVGLGLALAVVIGLWFWIYWGLPRIPDANAIWSLNRQPGITFLDQDGRVLGVRGAYHGRRVALRDLPSYVPQAFLAVEDRRFYEHSGVDRFAVVRALFANIAAGRTVQGGSTISQQLARNLFLTNDQTLNRKLREMVLASRIERRLSKDEILELYVNRVYLGNQAYGVDAAARRYFGVPATELTLAQAAMLAGLPKAPSRSTPSENFERARARQRVVLDAMVEAGFITREQRDEAAAETIRVQSRTSNEAALGFIFDAATEEARRRAPGVQDLVITVTVNRRLQDATAQAVRSHLGNRAFGRRPLQAAVVIVDRQGAVRALVGGTNYTSSQFNRATQARRQPGSSFKSFVYAAALERGVGTEDVRYDEPIVIRGWRPRNYDESYRGPVTVRTAFAQSLNTVAAELTREVGPERVAALATRFGITTMPAAGRPVPDSIALGSIEVTLWDMTQAFAAFMREGERVEAYLATRIENASGDLLYELPAPRFQRIYDQELSRQMTSLMGAVVLNGTGGHARLPGRDVAGKTGTSQDWSDAWFVGYTADFTAGVWVGYDQRAPMPRVTGGSLPADIWATAMRAAHQGVPAHPLAGIEQPRRSPRQVEMYSFFGDMVEAFGGDIIDALKPPDEE